jgi:hypothetical protein
LDFRGALEIRSRARFQREAFLQRRPLAACRQPIHGAQTADQSYATGVSFAGNYRSPVANMPLAAGSSRCDNSCASSRIAAQVALHGPPKHHLATQPDTAPRTKTDGALMATTDTNNTDLARAEILWKAADALRGQIDAAEYKHVVLGLLFLKYISDSFEARRDELKAELAADSITGPQLESLLENRDEYTAERVFWVPPEARWQNLQNQAARPDIATLIDDAILAVERDNSNLKNKLPRDYARRGIAPEKM